MLLHRAQSLGFVVHIMSSSEPRIAGPVISVTPARQELEPADE